MKILYVEDNPANLSLLQRIARMGGHSVITYTEGEAALNNFDKDTPDLVLMDVQLSGGMNGLDVVRKLRERGFKKPIVAVTAYAMTGDKERCIEAGCDTYIAKPLPVAELVELVQKFDAEHKGASEAASPNVAPFVGGAAASKPESSAAESKDVKQPSETPAASVTVSVTPPAPAATPAATTAAPAVASTPAADSKTEDKTAPERSKILGNAALTSSTGEAKADTKSTDIKSADTKSSTDAKSGDVKAESKTDSKSVEPSATDVKTPAPVKTDTTPASETRPAPPKTISRGNGAR